MPLGRKQQSDQKQQNRLSGGHQRYVLNDAYANTDLLSSDPDGLQGPWSVHKRLGLELPTAPLPGQPLQPTPAGSDHDHPDQIQPPSLGANRKSITTVDAAGDFISHPGRGIGRDRASETTSTGSSGGIASPTQQYMPNSQSPRFGCGGRSPQLLLVLTFVVGAAVGVGVVALVQGGLDTGSPENPAPAPAPASLLPAGWSHRRLVVTFPLEFDSLTETGRQQVVDQVVAQARAKAAAVGLTVAATDIASTSVSAGSVVITVTFGPAVNTAIINAIKTAGSAGSSTTGPAGEFILVGLSTDAWADGAASPPGAGGIRSTSVTSLDLANEVRARDEVISAQTADIANHTATIAALRTALWAANDRLTVLDAATGSPVSTPTPTMAPTTRAPAAVVAPSFAPTASPAVDICAVQHRCSFDCTGPCGWDYESARCRAGFTTTVQERELLLEFLPGDCSHHTPAPTTLGPTGAPTTVAPMSPIATHTPTSGPSTSGPTGNPTFSPPSAAPSTSPTVTPVTPSPVLTHTPTMSPSTTAPTVFPSTSIPTDRPSRTPTGGSTTGSPFATHTPTVTPTTGAPTTSRPSASPTPSPTVSPTVEPTTPSLMATHTPTASPTSSSPNLNPANSAPTPTPNSAGPTQWPSTAPSTLRPSSFPTGGPATTSPTSTHTPTTPPTSSAPTVVPSSTGPTVNPTSNPTAGPMTPSPISTHTPTAGPTTSAPTVPPESSSPTLSHRPSASPSTLAPTSDPAATLTSTPTAECVCPPIPVPGSCSPTTATHTPTLGPTSSTPSAAPTFSAPSASPMTPSPTTPPSTSPMESASPTASPSRIPTPQYTSFPALTAGGFSVIRLPVQTREGGTNQTLWYRDLCHEYGLRPVMCMLNEEYGVRAGTDYDLSGHPWNAVGLPRDPFECDFSSNDAYIGLETGWSSVVGYFRRAGSSCTWTSDGVTSTNGCLYQGFRTITAQVYPLCTNHTD